MKKLSLIFAAALSLLAVSCGQNKKNTEEAPAEEPKSKQEIYAEQNLEVQFDSLVAQICKINPIGVMGSVKDGKIVLSDKEKQVKPEYLVDPATLNDLQTLSQKYRAIALLCVDKEIAKLYGLAESKYTVALGKLYSDVNDPSLKAFAENFNLEEDLKAFYDESKKEGRLPLFWDAVSAALLEEMFVINQNQEKFLTAFDDRSAADFTWYIVTVTSAIDDLAAVNSEYKGLADSMAPLKEINAISVDQFREQLDKVKENVAATRDSLLK